VEKAAVSAAREEIFTRIRRSLRRNAPLAAPPPHRSQAPESNVRPRLEKDPLEYFIEKIHAAAGTVDRVTAISNIVQVTADYLDRHGLEPRLVVAEDPLIRELAWPAEWEIHAGPATGDDHIGVGAAFAGVAETGTLVMLSGADNPTTLNFLPDDHIVVVSALQIVAHLEDAWRLLHDGTTAMPRTVNLITGPSRTADVEQTIQLGAHGPRRLHVIVIED
jgi:L-lactate dehydrogenase complex protein LldG